MQLIDRNSCVISDHNDLETLFTFNKFPVFMGCTDKPSLTDLKEDMQWGISRSSGLIQLQKLLPLDVLYSEEHNSGVVGGIWIKHHLEFAKFIASYNPNSILELGGAHGILAKNYLKHKSIPWTILEPNPSPVEGCPAKFIKGFFDSSFTPESSYDAVVHSHVIEHIYEPSQFMDQLARFIEEDKLLIFSMPNMEVMLKNKYNNCINFEHTVFLTEPYIQFLLKKYGFTILRKEYFLDDHSIFYACKKEKRAKDSTGESLNGLYAKNKNIFNGYIEYYQLLTEDLNNKIVNLDFPVYLFGAHVFSQYLLGFGLNSDCIKGILDNDRAKVGKRLYGTEFLVQHPEILAQDKTPAVILRAGAYNNEIKEQILGSINPNTLFL